MKNVHFLLITGFAIALLSCATTSPGKPETSKIKHADISEIFDGVEGTFVLYDRNEDWTFRYNDSRAAERFSPCSTFKIPNSLIGLETEILEDAEFVIPWDEQKYPKEPWWDEILLPRGKDWARDHELRTAFAESVVWYYRELATRIGEEKMNRFLETFDYGNRDTSDGLDVFWLTGSLKISADEQIAFLKKLYFEQLGLSPRTTEIAKEVFVQERGDDYTLSAKTGTGGDEENNMAPIAWYVGYVEKGENVYFFALNLTGEDIMDVVDRRDSLAREILVRFGLISL